MLDGLRQGLKNLWQENDAYHSGREAGHEWVDQGGDQQVSESTVTAIAQETGYGERSETFTEGFDVGVEEHLAELAKPAWRRVIGI